MVILRRQFHEVRDAAGSNGKGSGFAPVDTGRDAIGCGDEVPRALGQVLGFGRWKQRNDLAKFVDGDGLGLPDFGQQFIAAIEIISAR